MNITPLHWLFASILAVTAHVAVFSGFELNNSVKIERATGVNISVGSLSSYASQSDVQGTSADEVVEAADSDVVEEEKPEQVQPDDTVNEVSKTTKAKILDEEKSSPVQSEHAETVQSVPKPPAQSPEQPDVTNPVVTKLQVPEKTPDDTVVETAAEKKKVPSVTKKTVAKPKKVRRKKPVRKKIKSAKRKTRAGRQTIAARRGSGGGGRQSSVSGSAAFSNYRGRVRARIASRIRKPAGLRGRVALRFTIVRTGRAVGARIISSSNTKLNRLALAAVRGNFQAIPPGMPGKITFTIPINFR